MGFICCSVPVGPAPHEPTLKDQQVGIARTPAVAISTPLSFGFIEAGHQDVLTLSPALKTVLEQLQVMTARKRTGHTPWVTAHRGIQPIGLEIKIIE